MNNLNLTQEDAEYIMNVIWPRREGLINGTRLGDVIKYVNLITGKELGIPGCSCEYRAMWGICYDIISQNLNEIENIVNGVVVEDIIVEKIISTEWDETTNTLSQTTVKARGRKKK
jgi:hypothetical protein